MPKVVPAWELQLKFRHHSNKLQFAYCNINETLAMAHRKIRAGMWFIDQARADTLTKCRITKRTKTNLEGTFSTPGADWEFKIREVEAETF
jgi:hypothetical protein